MSRIFLLGAVSVFAAANCLVVYLHGEGGPSTADRAGSLSMWNLLAAANFALLAGGLIFRRHDWNSTILKHIRVSEWFAMAGLGLVTAGIVPALFFTALVQTSVANVAIIACLEAPIAYLMTSIFLGREPHSWRVCGAFAAFAGVVLLIFLQGPDGSMAANGVIQLGTGELMAASAAIMLAVSTLCYSVQLGHVPMGIYVVTRSAVCAPLFVVIGLFLHGPEHLVGLFLPSVWPWVVGYALLFGLIGPLIWITGLRAAHPATVQVTAALTPVLAIVASVVLLDQAPTATQYIGGGVVFIGLSVGVLGALREYDPFKARFEVGSINAVDSGIGFKGV